MSFERIQHFLSELKHRRVFRVAGLYAVITWVIVQVAATVFPNLELPPWTVKLVVVLAILGFPVAVVLAWAFDLKVVPAPAEPPPANSINQPLEARPRYTSWLRYVLAVLVIAVIGGGGWAGWKRARTATGSRAGASPALVAVLPFDVRAGQAESYLRDGMVSLLAVRLDGAGDLHSVDPQVLLRSSATAGAVDTTAARKLALRYGAGLFVLGSVIGAGPRIQVTASLYETARQGKPLATASAEGAADGVFAIVDRIAIQLLSTRAGPEAAIGRTAALTTGSLPALKAYLEGERAFRENRIGPAVEGLTRAVDLDSTFALAWARLALARRWQHDNDEALSASAAARRHAAHLSPRHRELLDADDALLRGEPDVEARYRRLTERYPHDPEVWYRLGEVLFHHNISQGRSRMEARGPLEYAMVLDSANELYLMHLRDLACSGYGGDVHDLARLAPRVSQTDSLNVLTNGILLGLAGAPAERERVVMRLNPAKPERVAEVLNWAVYCVPDDALPTVFALAERLERTPESWGYGHNTELARGRWEAAEATLSPMRTLDPMPYLEGVSRALLTPLRTPPRKELEEIRADLLALDVRHLRHGLEPVPDSLNEDAELRLYWVGMLTAALGDTREALDYAARLERLPSSSPRARAKIPVRVANLRAFSLTRAGRTVEALRVLDELDALRIINEMDSRAVMESNPRSRWLRAELLRARGRDREALDWYITLREDLSLPSFLAPAHLRIAQLRERFGEKEEAARNYRRFIALWHDADPDVQPLVRDAQQHLAALQP